MGRINGLLKFFKGHTPPLKDLLFTAMSRQYLIRLDSRTSAAISAKKGFPETPVDLDTISNMHLAMHQLGHHPLGLGANITLKDLRKGFLKFHPEARQRTLFGFSGSVINLNFLTARLGRAEMSYTDSDGQFDREKEFVVQQHVPFHRFLFATSFKYREAFDNNVRVPNELFEFNPKLPKTLTQDDIKDVTSTITWLLEHDAELPAQTLVRYLFSNIDEKYFLLVLHERHDIVQEVRRLLSLDRLISIGTPMSFRPSNS